MTNTSMRKEFEGYEYTASSEQKRIQKGKAVTITSVIRVVHVFGTGWAVLYEKFYVE